MSLYYITAQDGTVIKLHATTGVDLSIKSTSSDLPIRAGFDVTTNVKRDPSTIKLTGVITDILTPSIDQDYLSPSVFYNELQSRIDNRERFTVTYSLNLPPLKNCALLNFNPSKSEGMADDSWNVTLDFKQLRIQAGSRVVAQPRELLGLQEAEQTKQQEEDQKITGCIADLEASGIQQTDVGYNNALSICMRSGVDNQTYKSAKFQINTFGEG